jgi:selenium donor protein
MGHGDDAGVYLLRDDLALVQTVDFFTPIVDDPEGFGAIAAANALSDVFAMGATPLTALNVVGFPAQGPPGLDVLIRVLQAGHAKAAEAGCAIIGGHTVDDPEPKYGLAVTGVAHPDALFRLDGARAGDALILTKPLGTGLLATGLKAGLAPPGTEARLIATCGALNDRAAQVARDLGVRAVTDVTGFGLTLHLMDILAASGLGADLEAAALPAMEGVAACLSMGLVPGGTRRNQAAAEARGSTTAPGISDDAVLLANDAQTSGGLLMAVPPERVDEARTLLGPDHAWIIGALTSAHRHARLA